MSLLKGYGILLEPIRIVAAEGLCESKTTLDLTLVTDDILKTSTDGWIYNRILNEC